MNELSKQSDVLNQIEASQKITDLLLIHGGILRDEQLLLANFELTIINKVIELLSNPNERYWCTAEEYQYLVRGLSSELSDKYKEAIGLAFNQGIEDFNVITPVLQKLMDKNQEQFRNYDNEIDFSVLITTDPEMLAKINGARRAIKSGAERVRRGKRNRRAPTEEEAPELSQLPFQEILNNAYNYALAILSIPDKEVQIAALNIFEELTIDKIDNSPNPFDVLIFIERFHPEIDSRSKSQQTTIAFESIGAYISRDLFARVDDAGQIISAAINPDRPYLQPFLPANHQMMKARIAILRAIFDQVKPETTANVFSRNLDSQPGLITRKALLENTSAPPPIFCERPDSFIDQPLADRIIALCLNGELEILRSNGKHDGFVVPSAKSGSGENVLLTWENGITRSQIPKNDNHASAIESHLPQLATLFKENLRVSEIAVLLAFLRPKIELDSVTSLNELKDEARGGMYPISKRGVTIQLDSSNKKDALLLKTGLSQITFKRIANNRSLKTIVRFGRRDLMFTIDEDMNAPELENLAVAEKEWLQRVIFSYLVAIKNRDIYQHKPMAPNEQTNGDEDLTTLTQPGKTKEAPKGHEGSSGSYLFVLPYSHRPKEWDDPYSAINLEVREEVGYSLLELNLHFALAQKDTGYLQAFQDETLKRILVSSLKRLEGKNFPENWSSTRAEEIRQKINAFMLGETAESTFKNPIPDIIISEFSVQDPEKLAMIGFRHEPEDPAGPPLRLKFATVSENLFKNIENKD